MKDAGLTKPHHNLQFKASLDSWQNEKLEAFSFVIGGQADISNTLQKKTTDLSEGVQVSWGFLHEWE